MGATQKSDIAFVPKVWSDHILAYFDRKMGLGQLALVDKTLTGKPGETVTFPYWKKVGAAQKPAENESLVVDKLSDDAFSCTVYELGKAVGWNDASIRKSATGPDDAAAESEAQRQMAQVIAEQVDADLITEISTSGKYADGFVAADANGKATVANILEGKVLGFGDKHDQAIAIAMHSLCFLDLMKDAGTAFLSAQATDPMYGAPGFQGRLLGQALFTLDSMPQLANVASKKTFAAYSFKANPFGIYIANDLHPEKDRDILARETIVTATMWLGILSLHAKVSASDKRILQHTFATSQAA